MKVLVIGSGLLGLVSAYALNRHGHAVMVLDRQAGPGRECSFANGAPGIGLGARAESPRAHLAH